MKGEFTGEYSWYYVFNSFEGEWRAAQERDIRELRTARDSQNVVRSKDINTLREILNKHDGLSAQQINALY